MFSPKKKEERWDMPLLVYKRPYWCQTGIVQATQGPGKVHKFTRMLDINAQNGC